MCGICGFNWEDEILIKSMCQSINHRGPDQEGDYVDKNISLGHKRLSIIDLSEKGRQPMSDKNEKIIIIFNGEIYNFQEIKNELEKKGYSFNSKTDTEVIINAYKEYGFDCVKKFNGMFAFCIFDSEKKIFFLVRDRLGIKPLYYYHKENKFIFCSELQGIMKHDIKKEINLDAMDELLKYGSISENRSIINSINKLEAGHYIIFNFENKSFEKKKYWDIEKNVNNTINLEDIENEIDRSVKSRLIADVPIGAFLSGGVDSSIIVAFASQYVKDFKTFSVSFDVEEFDESKFARMVAEKFKTNHTEIKITAKEIINSMNDTADIMDEPLGEPTAIATHLLCKKTSKYVKVCLTGDGGDEVFCGYARHKLMYQLNKIRPFRKILPFNYKGVKEKLKGEKSDMFEKIRTINPRYNLVKNTKSPNLYKKYFKFKNILDNVRFIDLKLYTCNDLLKNMDLNSMKFGLEARVPLLDHEIVSKAFSLRNNQLIRKGESKYLLKKIALKRGIPKECIYRKKRGFSIPYREYIKNDLREMVENEILKENHSLIKYLKEEELQKVVNEHMSEKYDNSTLIITLIFLKKWLERNGF